ncbi:hypothetical protein [Streptomyces sp. NPDC051219]|uniref:hypothetical protein n=1 Tax=Streptomyces sp. NPDC051219 TaxID=3155283 RepID=UPI00341BCA7C
MKQSAAKTLGVAALGAAFAAAAAGTASAAPAPALPDVTGLVGGVTSTLPAKTANLPTDEALGKGTDPVKSLLGGVPLAGGLTG